MDALTVETSSTPLSEASGPVLPVAADAPATLADILRRASEAPAPGVLVQVARDGAETALSYREVRERAERILGGLRARGARPGDRIVLQAAAAGEFIPALWACLLGGFTALPAPAAGEGAGASQAARRLRDAWAALERPLVVAGAGAEAAARAALGAGARVAEAAELAAHAPDPDWHAADPGSDAVLLLSSGTTGRPKLIRRTHHNLLRVCQASPAVAGYAGPPITFLGWLPLDHNAGLTGTLILFAAGARQVRLDTRDVLDDPERWLDALHRHRVTRTGVTNYFLGLAAARLAEVEGRGWDFSCVESVGVTAEPVVVRTVRAFLERMACYGLRPNVIRPSYGMSEAGAIAGLPGLRLDAGGDDEEAFVEAYRPSSGISLRVVDGEGRVVPEGAEGRIQVRGETVTPGYALDPELTRESFTADGWFDTGDAGVLRGGLLTVTGREKDLLIVNGLNVHGQEVEAALEEIDGVERGCAAVCAVRVAGRDGDAAAVFLHTPLAGAEERAALRREVRRVAASRFGLPATRVLLLERGEIPRTGTGKIRRAELRRLLEAGAFAAAAAEDAGGGGGEGYVAPRTALEREICAVWADALGVERVGVHDDFVGLGGHSLLAGRIAARVRAVSGADVPLRLVFEHPTVAGLAAAVEAWRRDEEPAGAPEPTPAEGPHPLSFGQQRLWFIDQFQPGGSAYNLSRALRLKGPLDAAALERALGEIVRRHEPLRTVFPAPDGDPVQVVLPAAAPALPVDDLSALSVESREAEVARRAREDAAAPFDLSTGPLFRATLLRLDPAEHVLLLAMHHIVGDGWSVGVLYREIEALYAAFSRGEPSPLAPLPLRYADHAARQRAERAGEALERALAWWRARLEGAPALLELPTDRPRPAVPSHRGAVCRFALPRGLGERLAAVGREEGATLFMTLLAAFQLLLAKYSGQEDVVVGAPVAGRDAPELEGLIGFFANTVALRTDLSRDPTFRQLLRRVREGTLGAFAHQELPFEKLVEELQPERSLSHSPLFQVMFALQNAGGPPPRLSGIETSPLRAEGGAAMFDLSLHMAEKDGELRGTLEYAVDLFDAATAERMAVHLRMLLEGIASAPETRLSALELMGPDERRLVVEEWNQTDAEHPADRCVHQLFEAQAARTPDSAAVTFGDRSLTYRELDERANRLARHLAGLGAGPDARVGLCLERGPEMMVALLGILKSGAAYVPLDPAYPAERLAYMLEDSAARVLVTQRSLAERLPAGGTRVVRLDADAAEIARHGAGAPRVPVGPDSLAYVIYTSGSTGRPKGVAMPHRPLANLLAWQERGWRAPAAVTLQFATISFDVSFQEIFSCWCAGGRLVLIGEEPRYDPAALLETMERQGVERLFMPAAVLQQLAEAANARGGGPPRLREVVTAGEQLRVTGAMREWLGALGAPLHNHYGPSETHVVTSLALEGDPSGWPLLPAIGAPIANTRCYVLDGALGPVPVGVPGELYLGGESLARGYLDRPGLTAGRFVPDPFGGGRGARLYRTGDRVRWLPTGVLEFLGRADEQVKLRGFRIEPGEVEAVLAAHPAVREAVVVVREDAPGDRRLVAYVVAAGGAAVDSAALRAHLKGRLPEYMVPGAFVALDALPLTPSGKVARRALPAPEHASAGEGYVAPRTATEAILAEIYAHVLGADRVGVAESFFTLGGHSLLAMRMISRVRAAFGIELPVHAVFEAPTVAELAERVEALRAEAFPRLPPVVPVDRTEALPLSFAQERLWFLDRLEPESAFYNLPRALRLRAAVDARALERALGEVLHRHEALRTTFREVDGVPVQVIAPWVAFTLPVEDLSDLDGEAREARARLRVVEEGARPFDLSAGPLLRARLLRLADEEHVLLLCIHHIASDAWSMGVLFRELSVLYEAYREGRESPLAPLEVQYADYAVWQRRVLGGAALDGGLAWWRERLSGAPALLELPTDHPRPAVQGYGGAYEVVRLPAELVERLRAFGRSEGATLYMVLLGAFKALLSRYSGSDDVVVGSPVAGRARREVEELIGFFVNTLVLRTDLSGDPGFRQVLRRVREVALDAYEHQEVPFERVVEALRPERSLSHSPLFQVMFTLADGGEETLRLGAVERLRSVTGSTAFDLSLSMVEDGGGLRGTVEYRPELFEPSTVERMLGHFTTLLAGVAARPDEPISAIGLLDAAERRLVLEEWNATAYAFPRDRTVHEMIAAQARRTPGAPAVAFDGGTLSYARLDVRANRLARHLRRLGVGPESRVAVSMERGPDVAVAVLGVLKAGGAYVPVDPAYPADRLLYMLEDSGAEVLLTERALVPKLPDTGARVVRLDADREVIAAESAEPFESGATPENLAYVIYTSGSTGRPKGVAVAHRAVVNYAVDIAARWGMRADDRVLQFASLSFDVVVEELFPAWMSGGAVVLSTADLFSPPELGRAIAEHGVTWLELPTAYWHEWVHELARGALAVPDCLRFVVVGGERVSPERLAEWAGIGLPLVHVFGLTETACTSATLRLEAGDDGSRWPNLPVGTPTGNVRLYVVDGGGQPVPPGVPGELFIGGEGVARGYLGRPALTAERFVPDPHSGEPGARLYRTGDRVRWLADGTLEFLGRIDHQVKIRGFRVETGEVEAALTAVPGVREAFVMAREDVPGDRRLVAYVVADEAAASPAGLRARLGGHLPEYMVPAAFVALDALPLTPNGKVDRKALPAPEYGAAEERHVAPRTPVEEVLAGIWAEVLRLERVGVEENFFEMGGHSLLATRVVSRIREALSVELPLRALFEAPTVAGAALRVEELRRAGLPVLPPVVPVERTEALPLSFAQERLWFLDRLQPDSAFYNVPTALRLSGTLDERALERALGEIVRRHEALRTTFVEVDGAAAQVVAPFAGFTLPVEEPAGLDVEAREAEARRLAAEDAARPFDLAAGPVFRPRLLRLGPEEHVLLLCAHHIASDAWSMGVLFRELSALYAAYREGGESPLADLPVQYADYAAWQRRVLQGEALDAQLAYWRERLAGAPSLLELPTDHPRPAAQSYRGAYERIALPGELAERLRGLARSEGATLHMVLLGAFQVLLSKYGGGDDVMVGTPVAGRARREVEELIGLFVNTLVLRTDLSGDPSFREVLGRVREAALGAYEHQEVPFEKLVAELQPARSLSHSPLVQVMFTLEGADGPGGELSGLRVRGVVTELGTTKFDLSLALLEDPRGLRGALTYSTDLFERTTIHRMLGHLERVLEQIAADADVRLSGVDLVGESERRLMLEEWNRTETAPPPERTLHQLFAAQAARTPDAVAVLYQDRSLTYTQLDERANRLAHHLIRLGVGPEARVALCLERGPEMVVSLLAVLKAGGAYVPLDPGYPAERLAFMLADSAAAVLLTEEKLRGRVPARAGVRVVSVDGARAEVAAQPSGAPLSGAAPRNLAYLIYTSGSTGEPKGVAVEHAGVASYLAWAARAYPGRSTAVHSSLSFDLTVTSLFVPLLCGGCVELVEEEDPVEGLAARLGRGRSYAMLKLTPAHLRTLGDRLRGAESGGGAECLVVGGEQLLGEELEPWKRRLPEAVVVNEYGPTEAVVGCCIHVQRLCETAAGPLPIGRPVANTRLYVLDAARQPVPVGVPGELYIGGAQMARGYLGRPGLTAERFVPDPFAPEPGARLYRTGDKARWRVDGMLEYLGRLDEQVKIRGFRVELGEIEAVMCRHPGIAECVALAREDAPGQKRLVAYVVGEADSDALRAHLRRSLPEYMVPAAFVSLDKLPLTPNGKLDRKALPVPEFASAERYVAPRTPVEETLAAVWAEVLRLDRVGVRDNFFELGGDSILSIQVVSRARRAGVEITPRQMFEYQTIAELASVVGKGGAAAARHAEQGRVGGAVRLTPIQAYFFEHGHAAPWHYNQAVLLGMDSALSDAVLETALHAVLEHHDAFRLRFRLTDAGWEQWHAEQVGIALERVDLSDLAPEERNRAQDEAAGARQASLELERGPLGRAVLFDRGDEGRALFLVFHHLVIDGVSWRILREDLERACAQGESGGAIDLGAKSSSFREWSEALQAYAERDGLGAEALYWLAQGPDGVAPLPVEGAREDGAGGERRVTVRLDEDETRALLQDVPAAYRTQVNDALLCALAEAVGAWTGSPRVRLALEGHGREEEVGAGVDLTRTAGWFTSVYPVVLDVGGAAGPGERLKAVKEQLRAIPKRGIGYGVLRYLSPESEVRRELAAHADPEIQFNYLGQFDAGFALSERFRFAGGPRGRDSAEGNRLGALLEVNGGVEGGRLRLDWSWREGTLRPEAVERVASAYLDALRGLIAHCCEAGAGGYTPSDFPLAGVTPGELDAALAGRRDVEDLYPLSPMQEGLLFHALSGGESQAYQSQSAHLLEGPLDVEGFRRAWAEVVGRHGVLRTAFVWQGLRRPLQRVQATAEVPWRVEDWTALPEAEREAALERCLAEDRARGFALGEAPLLRCALFRVGAEAHWFLCSHHHLLLDGWSFARVLHEVFRIYRGWTGGREVELSRARPYRDYIGWLQRRDPGAAERYWTGVLDGFAAPTPLGVDRPSGPEVGARHARVHLVLSAERTRRLEEAARRAQVTLNTMLQGAWALLLSRCGGSDDVVFGHVVAGRPAELEGVEEMVGVFINTIPVRVRPRGDARVGAWLAELQRTQVEAREHEYTPLVQVQGWSEVPRGTPLFETLLVTSAPDAAAGEDAAAEAMPRITRTRGVEFTTYPLTLAAAPGARLWLGLGYDQGRFDAATAERMLEQLGRVLDQLAGDPHAPLSAVEMAGADERRLLVETWNRTARPYPRGVCIHELFDARVREAPDAPALVWGDESLTYAELDARANRQAHHLVRLGVGPESRVGVLLERGVELIVSLLAVLKAGGCYVPLDPSYPAERLELMLADAGARVLLTRRDVAAAPAADGLSVVNLDDVAEALAAERTDAPRSGASAENLAYIVYTSGSTGRPKGVMVAHRHVVQLVCETDYVRFAPGDRVAQASNASFDALTFEAWGALTSGATLVGIPREVLLSPRALRELLREGEITTLYQTTALLNQLSREQPDIFASLREVLFGGQAADAESVRRIVRSGKPQRLLHMYGPTETTAWCSWEQVERVDDGATAVPVGRPTGNQRIYLLDSALRPAPVGVPGEAYVGGDGVVRGYLDRPALTAERFLPDPFADEPGARMYRTGDRLRWRGDGTLEFVGRVDQQVKIRGFRIEPGEVESALSTHPWVDEARVVVREDEPGEKRLVAYVVGEVNAPELREHLRRSLPEYMVPEAYVVLDRLPLTPNGKLDFRALPAPGAEDAGAYVAPRTPLEEVLAEIWAEVLRLERVGMDDDFFELGGHSLLVIRVVSRVQEIFGFELSLRTLFDASTVAALAALLESDPRYAAGAGRVAELMIQVRQMAAD